ncbi:MAG: DUF3365 domain-containing protein [Nitrospira sp.]|nr:DUF3365 domain-containing protein [Nitrospira sp.]MDR4483966.1 DUF3365 domain-containing protein [Nitrospirales bacterium]
MKRLLIGLFLLVPLLLGSGQENRAQSVDEAIASAKLLAKFFDMGRLVVGENQTTINDPAKGDKGFTPEVFTTQITKKFEAETGLSWSKLEDSSAPPQAKRLLQELLAVQQAVIKDRQSLINLMGVGFKGFIPASFGTTVSLRFRRESGAYLKQTAATVRNRRNTPDEHETATLKTFASEEYPHGKTLVETVDDGQHIRVMVPVYYQDHCLVCHGGPKGELDKTGHAKEGGQLGQLGGAISVRLEVP